MEEAWLSGESRNLMVLIKAEIIVSMMDRLALELEKWLPSREEAGPTLG